MKIFELASHGDVLYHVSKTKNRKNILAHGLEPRIENFENISRSPGVYMFSRLAHAVDWAFWFALDQQEPIDIFEIVLPEGYTLKQDTHPEMADIYDAWIGKETIPADNIELVKTQKVPKSTNEAPPFSESNAMKACELIEEGKKKLNNEEFKHLLTPALIKLGNLYEKNGFDLRIVGGAVRDLVLGHDPKDVDLASDATPQESLDMLKKAGIKTIETGLQHGTITAVIGGADFEITTLRVDTEHTGRHATVEYTKSWEKDAERRDLTFNAMSLDLHGTLYDYFGGLEDLKAGKARFVGDANERMQEDYLRILRYFRFQGRTNKPNWDEETLNAIELNAKGLEKISGERIWMEFQKILAGKHTKDILDKMRSTGVDLYIDLPPLDESMLDRVKAHTKNPATILGGMLQNEAQVDKLAAKWKFSAQERELMKFTVNHKRDKFDLDVAKAMWTDKKIKNSYVAELAKFFGREDILNSLKSWKMPAFPITGNDLISLGVKPGPDMGKMLQNMQQHWKQTGYKLSKDELLKWAKLK